jgi:hypothetical protein
MPGARKRFTESDREEKEPGEKGEENIVESTVSFYFSLGLG